MERKQYAVIWMVFWISCFGMLSGWYIGNFFPSEDLIWVLPLLFTHYIMFVVSYNEYKKELTGDNSQ